MLTDQQIANAALAAGFTMAELPTAVAIALAESGGDPLAHHVNTDGTTDDGLWQVNSVHGYPVAELRTVLGNARAARAVYLNQGWRAWSAYKNGSYLAFLVRGRAVAGSATAEGGGSGADVVKGGPLSGLTDLARMLTDPRTWQRTGLFIIGGVLIIIALFKLTGDNTLSDATKAAAVAVAK